MVIVIRLVWLEDVVVIVVIYVLYVLVGMVLFEIEVLDVCVMWMWMVVFDGLYLWMVVMIGGEDGSVFGVVVFVYVVWFCECVVYCFVCEMMVYVVDVV